MPLVFVRSIVVGLLVAGSAAGTAEAQESAPQKISIEDALASAETTGAGLVAARARIVGAQRQVDVAKSGYYPQVNGNASYGLTLASEFDGVSLFPDFGVLLCPFTDDTDNVFCGQRYQDLFHPAETEGSGNSLPFGQRNTWRVGASVAQPIYTGGRTGAAVAAAEVGVAIAKLTEQQIRTTAVFNIANTYYTALLTQRAVEITEASLASAEAVLQDAQLANVNGAIAEFDVVRAEVARDNERNRLVAAKKVRDNAVVFLKRLMRLPPERAIELTSTLELDDTAGDDDDRDGVIAKAIAAARLPAQGKRLPLVQAELAVRASQHARKIAAADRLPQITAVSDFGLVDYGALPFNGDWKNNWTVGVNLSIPIFDGFRRRAEVRKAEADIAAARGDLEDATLAAHADDAIDDVTIAAALETWQSSARTVALAKRAYEIADLRFSQGASTQLELVDARLQLNLAENNHANSAHDLRVARLRRALAPGLAVGFGH